MDELFNREQVYCQKIQLFKHYEKHCAASSINVLFGELKATLQDVENLHSEIRNSFADEATFQNVFIEKKNLFLIYGPFIQRCHNITKQLPNEEETVTPEEKAKIKAAIEKDLPGGFIPLSSLLVLPFQHISRYRVTELS